MIAFLFATVREAEPSLALFGVELGDKTDGVRRSPPFELLSELSGCIVICGMGKTAARDGTTQLIRADDVDTVVNVGIAGGLVDQYAVGDVCAVGRTVDWGAGVERALDCDPGPFTELPVVCLVTSDKPVFDPRQRAKLGEVGELVDMEGAAVAEVCQAGGVRCHLLKCISDLAGHADRKTLLRNIDKMATKLAHELRKVFYSTKI